MSALLGLRALIVGVGGLGCPASLVLARAGIGALTLVDPDVVDATNLHRQLWHSERDLGRAKVASASAKLCSQFPLLAVGAIRDRVTERNVDALFAAHEVVIDGTDGTDAKFLLSDAAVRTGVPLVYGGVLRLQGQAMVISPGGPCLRCLFEAPPSADELPTCAQAGVLGSMAGVIGALQGQLALGAPALISDGQSTLHTFDGAAFSGRRIAVKRAPDCPACGSVRDDRSATWKC